MENPVNSFGNTAKDLSRNPLGIIALFIVLVYGFACLVVGVGLKEPSERLPIVYFLVFFPVLVLAVFLRLVSRFHQNLYAPSDFKDEANFLATVHPGLKRLPVAQPGGGTERGVEETLSEEETRARVHAVASAEEMAAIYESSRHLFVAHVLYPTSTPHVFDIFLFLVRHGSNSFDDVAEVEFFFGQPWGNQVFPATKTDDLYGIRTSANAPFLCTCHVHFKDGATRTLYRYVDFEMGRAIAASK